MFIYPPISTSLIQGEIKKIVCSTHSLTMCVVYVQKPLRCAIPEIRFPCSIFVVVELHVRQGSIKFNISNTWQCVCSECVQSERRRGDGM